ncbi:MAG: polysaccharide deacetylase family protein [bacterium]|nr:polysaccharide deacetylase family protein [bacterium]
MILPPLLTGCTAPGAGRVADTARTFDHGAIVRADTSLPTLALIFTGGEHGEGTEHILHVLNQRKVKASFFVTGQYLANEAYQPHVRRMVNEGHYVGPHSHAHLLYCPWDDRARTLVTKQQFREDLLHNINELRRLGALRGPGPVYFIPPYEWFNEQHVSWAGAMEVVLFNFTPGSRSNRDWIPEDHPGFVNSEVIVQDILEYERNAPHGLNGHLLLLHLGGLRKDKVFLHLDALIGELRRRGYAFARVDEMLGSGTD